MRKAKPVIIVIIVALLIFAAVFAFFVINAEPTATAHSVRVESGMVDISIQVLAPRKIIKAVRVDNLDGASSLWRSDGQEEARPLAVRHGDTELSSGSTPMAFKPGLSDTLLSLRLEDNGAFSGKNTDFRITVFFSDGTRVLCELSAEQIAQGSAAGASALSTETTAQNKEALTPTAIPEAASERWTLMDFIAGVLVGIIILIIALVALAKAGLVMLAKKGIEAGGEKIIGKVQEIAKADDVQTAIKERVSAISQTASGAAKKRMRDFINTQKENGGETKNIGRHEEKPEEDGTIQAEEKRQARAEKIKREKEAREFKFKRQKRTEEAKLNDFLELCENGTWEEITVAVENGANLNMKNAEGLSGVMIMVGKNQNPEVIANLIEDTGDNDLSWLLWVAARNPNPEVIRVLIEAGADVNAMVKGSTALMVAASTNSNPEALEVLLEAGADIDEANDDGLTPLMLAAAQNPNPAVLRALLGESGGNINVKDDEGCPLVMWAAKSNPSPEIISFFIESGADLDTEFEGTTPLIMAVANNPNPEVVLALIRNDRERQIALIQAKKKKRQDVVEALVGV